MIELPGWMVTMFVAMSPISELRGAIPLAIGFYGLPPWEAYLLSVTGNLIPVIPLLLFLGPVSELLMRHPWGHGFFTWLFSRTRRKHLQKSETFGMLALAIFVAIPLPMTGAWTGCLIAFLLGMRFWESFLAVAAGVLVAGLLITATVIGSLTVIGSIL
ncbi:MAG: putative small multi-drug export protein [Methanosaeta sp. PtaB.Bin039]|nr:MAG: putative small multi-drug export protein [Methanosaeta sp. PtaB.Bin039]OPY46760.1 MAG: putative small multi-drug export protein [Methanosaeta sp. PtaU1.Bin028]